MKLPAIYLEEVLHSLNPMEALNIIAGHYIIQAKSIYMNKFDLGVYNEK